MRVSSDSNIRFGNTSDRSVYFFHKKCILPDSSLSEYNSSSFPYQTISLLFFIGFYLLTLVSCKAEDKDLIPVKYPSIAEVFIDNFSSGLDYAAFGNSDRVAFFV